MRKWLLDIRRRCGMSQRTIAAAAGISQVGYCLIERGEREPSVNTAKRIADALGFEWTRFYE